MQRNKSETEALAAEAILDKNLRINLPAPFLLRILGKRTISLRFKRPTAGQLLEMSAMYVRMGIDIEELDKGELRPLFASIAVHARTCSRIIATGLIRSRKWRFFFRPVLARYLVDHTDMATLAEIARLLAYLSTAENFATIIRSVAFMKITEPTLSHSENGS